MKKLTDEEERRALELHQGAIVIDALNASIMDEDYFQKMQQGGVTVTNYTIAMNQNLSETVKRIAQLYRQMEKTKVATLIENTADIRRAKQEGKTGIILGFQNVGPLEVDMSLLRIYYRLGIRIIQLTYHFRDVCGDGCKEPANSGLSLFGAELIRRMNDMGMVVDLAHVGERACLEAIEASRHPVIASHSNVYSLVPTYQNKRDGTIKALAAKGGVIGITGFPRLLDPDPTLDMLLDHVDYVVQLVGVDRVGIGLDFAEGWPDSPFHRKRLLEIDGQIYDWPEGIETVSKWPNIARGLVSRGYTDAEIVKILGGNLLRVFGQVIG
ncbi:MAG: dipeptidase [Chloroflexi bacterium]|nr:dipeptidase [Chloroflexota bacterium]